jgi:predicted acetyltransferase
MLGDNHCCFSLRVVKSVTVGLPLVSDAVSHNVSVDDGASDFFIHSVFKIAGLTQRMKKEKS